MSVTVVPLPPSGWLPELCSGGGGVGGEGGITSGSSEGELKIEERGSNFYLNFMLWQPHRRSIT